MSCCCRRHRFCRNLARAVREIERAIEHLAGARANTSSAPVRALLDTNIGLLRVIRADKIRLGRRLCTARALRRRRRCRRRKARRRCCCCCS